MTTTPDEYRATAKVFALLRPEGGGLLLFRPWHITLDSYRVTALPGAVTPLAAPEGEWTHQIKLDTHHGPRVLRLTTEAAEVAALAIERWTAGAMARKERARRKKSTGG